MFQLVVISSSAPVLQEAVTINSLFDTGLELLHIRKPGVDATELEMLLQDVNPVHRSKIALHQNHHLAGQFQIKRLHFPEQQRLAVSLEQLSEWKKRGFALSTSIHRMEDYGLLPACFDYAFYGPVFESISKQGYAPKENVSLPGKKQRPVKLIAIGGIAPERIGEVKHLGFDGAAMLGAIWNDPGKAPVVLHRCYDQLKQAEPC